MSVYDEIKQLELDKKKIRSKSMFDDDFFGQIDELMEQIGEVFKNNISLEYKTEYTSLGNYEAKIKINDDEKVIYKLINCKLTYKKSDIKFGYIHPEIISDEKGQKTRTYKLGKFPILKHEKIIKDITEKLIEVIEEY